MDAKGLSLEEIDRQIAELNEKRAAALREAQEREQAEVAVEILRQRRVLKDTIRWLQEHDESLPEPFKSMDARAMPRETANLKKLAEKAKSRGGGAKGG